MDREIVNEKIRREKVLTPLRKGLAVYLINQAITPDEEGHLDEAMVLYREV